MNLSLSNVMNVSVSATPAGIGQYNTSNIGLLTHEAYSNTFGTLGYKIYSNSDDVATDFGSQSITYAMALAIYSQQPNITAGGGYLTILPMLPAVQLISFSAVPDAGSMIVNYGGAASAAINYNDTLSQIAAKIQAIPALATASVTGSLASGLTISLNGTYGPDPLVTISSNTMMHTASPVTETVTTVTAGETVGPAVTRTDALISYFGVLSTIVLGQTDLLAAAAIIQAKTKILFAPSRTQGDVAVSGALDLLRSGSLDQTRGIYYGTSSDILLLSEAAAYAGRALSTDFSGSNTTSTMHLKDLIGVQADPTITTTILNLAQAAGADTFVSLQGIAKVFCAGANKFFDQVYNRLSYVGAVKVAVFNFLAQSATKIPQTESGMDAMKSTVRQVCEQYVANGYLAPGSWTSPTTFGDQADFLANIKQKGYYIYSTPIALQSAADRAARKAPLVQVAMKEAGAIHSANLILNINQ